ncbi:retrovirus-related pol polyprotein from transposon TNT 1-94 [Tanacetum coccineum]
MLKGSKVRAEGNATRKESSSKRAGDELKQENAKKQKMDEDKETAELQSLMEVIPDEEEVAVDAIPLATKPPSIVDYKIIKEGKISYYQIIRADGSSKRYSAFIQILRSFNREDLETLWKLVKAKHGSTRPEEGYERVLWGDLKTMFEHHVEDLVWRNLQGNKVLVWKLFDSCGVHFMSKDEAIDKFVLYKTEVENQLGRKIKVVRSDRGGEYVSPFAELCAKHGIRHEFTAPYSPQQNGIAERKNRTLKEMVNAMLISSGLSQDMWGEAILTATYLLNKIPRKEKEETPYELWMGRKPSYQYLRVWGCLAKVVVPTPKAQKIRPKSVDCIFIGYAKNSSAYRFIVHDSKNPDIQKNAVMESRNASFFENIFPCLTKETGSSSRLDDEVVQDKRQRDDNDLHDERQDQLEEEEVEPRRSKRARTEKSFGPDFVSFMVENEPTSYREAVTSSEGHQWKEAIKSEIDSILQNHTWELVDLPPGCKPLGYKWIFKKKMKADGTIDKYKARLVIKGYRQREGLDYFDTYSPVTRITSIRMVLAIAALRNLEVHQMDVKTAFLNEDLEEEIYMNQPEGFIAPGQESKVCRLVKSLYGLKQAPKQWHQKFDDTILESGFKINECDKCVYVKDTSSGYVIMCLYVNDMLIIGSNDKMIKSTKYMLKSKFDIQAYYMDKILNTHNAGDSGLTITPIDTSTRPDLAYFVIRLSRYTSNPSDAHWKAMTRVLHYLRILDRLGGYVFTLEGVAISGKSSKKTVIAKSMMDSEFFALDK